MADYAGRYTLTAVRADGSRAVLEDVENFQYNVNGSVTEVKGMSRRNAIRGTRRGIKMITGSFDDNVPIGDPILDWFELLDSGEKIFLIVQRGIGGKRRFFEGLTISEADDSSNAEGEAKISVSFIAETEQAA